jgi:hypothetical protein
MYVIQNHEVLVVVEYGDETTQSSVGLEVAPPLNEAERNLIKDWMNRHNKSVLSYLVDQISHGADAGRYGEQVAVGDTDKLERKIGDLALCIRRGIESGGKSVGVEWERRILKKDGILGS